MSKTKPNWEKQFNEQYGSFQLCDLICKLDSDRLKAFIAQTIQQEKEEAVKQGKLELLGEITSTIDLNLPRMKAQQGIPVSPTEARFIKWTDEVLEYLKDIKSQIKASMDNQEEEK